MKKDIKFTQREREIVILLATGLNNREIGETMFISIHTVKAHLEHMFEKTGVHNRIQWVMYAFKNGFLE